MRWKCKSQRELQPEIKRDMEFAIVPLELVGVLVTLFRHELFGLGKLVIGRNQPRFPFEIGPFDRQFGGMAFEQAARLGDVDQVGERRRARP